MTYSVTARWINIICIICGLGLGAGVDIILPGCHSFSILSQTTVPIWMSIALLIALAPILAIALCDYIRPMNRVGAMMTGVCAYALIALFLS